MGDAIIEHNNNNNRSFIYKDNDFAADVHVFAANFITISPLKITNSPLIPGMDILIFAAKKITISPLNITAKTLF